LEKPHLLQSVGRSDKRKGIVSYCLHFEQKGEDFKRLFTENRKLVELWRDSTIRELFGSGFAGLGGDKSGFMLSRFNAESTYAHKWLIIKTAVVHEKHEIY